MLNWAIIGTGFISHTVAEAITASSGSQIHTVVGRSAETLAAFQATHAIPNATSDFQTALNDPNVDAVYISLPNHLHHETTIAASNAGKAVLCEKSLTTTMGQAHALADAVLTNQTFFVEGLMYLAHPLYAQYMEILQDGRLGALKAIHGHYAADIWNVTNPLGKGTIYNLGCYPASLLHLTMQTLCGPDAFQNRKVQAHASLSPKDGTIITTNLSARFGEDIHATLHSTDAYGMAHSFVVAGEKGEIRFLSNPWLPEKHAHLQWCPYNGAAEDIFVHSDHDAFFHQVNMVETALAKGQTQATRPSPRLQDSLEIMSFLTDWETACVQ